MGVCEGVFPARVEDDGLFSDKEKEMLAECGVEITSTVERRICDELYHFYSAVCAPAEELHITYPVYDKGGKKTRRSPALLSIEEMFPKLREGEAYKVAMADYIAKKYDYEATDVERHSEKVLDVVAEHFRDYSPVVFSNVPKQKTVRR